MTPPSWITSPWTIGSACEADWTTAARRRRGLGNSDARLDRACEAGRTCESPRRAGRSPPNKVGVDSVTTIKNVRNRFTATSSMIKQTRGVARLRGSPVHGGQAIAGRSRNLNGSCHLSGSSACPVRKSSTIQILCRIGTDRPTGVFALPAYLLRLVRSGMVKHSVFVSHRRFGTVRNLGETHRCYWANEFCQVRTIRP